MINLVCAMAYGDCLITLSLLEQMKLDQSEYRILGTGVTRKVSSLLNRPFPVTELLPDKAAFYTISADGPWKALSDFVSLRRALGRAGNPGDVFAFERGGLRNRVVTPLGFRGHYAPQTHRAYKDRQEWVRQLFGSAPVWVPARRPAGSVRSVSINPCARFGNRWLAPEIIENVIAISKQQGWSLSLIDPCGCYDAFQSRVEKYVARPELVDAAAMLKASDLYIGPDSFFVHLAYYYRVPVFGFFFSHYHDFLLPGMKQLGSYLDFKAAEDPFLLEQRLMKFLAGAEAQRETR